MVHSEGPCATFIAGTYKWRCRFISLVDGVVTTPTLGGDCIDWLGVPYRPANRLEDIRARFIEIAIHCQNRLPLICGMRAIRVHSADVKSKANCNKVQQAYERTFITLALAFWLPDWSPSSLLVSSGNRLSVTLPISPLLAVPMGVGSYARNWINRLSGHPTAN